MREAATKRCTVRLTDAVNPGQSVVRVRGDGWPTLTFNRGLPVGDEELSAAARRSRVEIKASLTEAQMAELVFRGFGVDEEVETKAKTKAKSRAKAKANDDDDDDDEGKAED